MNVRDLIDALGGNAVVAAQLRVRSSAISNWRHLNALPPRILRPMKALCDGRGIEFSESWFREVSRTNRDDNRGPPATRLAMSKRKAGRADGDPAGHTMHFSCAGFAPSERRET